VEPSSRLSCLQNRMRPITQVLAFAVCIGHTAPAVPAGTDSTRLRCFTVSPGLTLRKQEVENLIEAVRRNSRRPVITIERPDESDYAPQGVVQAVILTSGVCDHGCSNRLWLRKGKNGWRVLKKLEGECWTIFH
jgi:hypothetical protein